MKFIIFTLVLMFSNIAMSKSFCTSKAAESLTQSLQSKSYDENTPNAYYVIRAALTEKCHELEKSAKGEDISYDLMQFCMKMAKEKLKGKASEIFLINCSQGYEVSSAYFDGLHEGQKNGYSEASKKGCVEKTAVSELSRASKAIENEISTSKNLKKTSDK